MNKYKDWVVRYYASHDSIPEGHTDGEFMEELIRCKDCRHWRRNPINESTEWGLCFKHKDVALATDRTDWCSWAERKDNETD